MASPLVALARGLGLSRGVKPASGEALAYGPRSYGATLPSHPFVGERLDPQRLQSILYASELGQQDQIQDLYDDMRERDLRLRAVCRQRVLALVGKDWSLEPPAGLEDDETAKDVARRTRRLLAEIPGISRVVASLVDGALRGFSVQEIVWPRSRDARGFLVPERIVWRHAGRFAFDQTLTLRKWDLGDPYPGIPLEDYGPAKFIVHAPTAGTTSLPTRYGDLRGCVWPALTKRFGWRWWLRAAERFGQPAPVIQIEGEADAKLAAAAARALRQLSDDWAAVLTRGMSLHNVPGAGSVTGELHERLIKASNTEIAVGILGQNLTTEISDSGSRAAVEGHDVVRGEILAGDAQEAEDTLTEQLVRPLVMLNFPGEPISRWKFQLVANEQREPQEWHVERGIVSADEVREYLGLSPRVEGDGPLADEVDVPGGGPGEGDPLSREVAAGWRRLLEAG